MPISSAASVSATFGENAQKVGNCSSPIVTTTPIPANRTGLWWNAAEAGWGINVSQQGDLAFATLFK